MGVIACLPGLVHYLHGRILLDCNHHGLENVHIPAIGNAEPYGLVRLGNQPAAQRNSKIASNNSQDYRLAHPVCVSTFHDVSPLLESRNQLTSEVCGYGKGGPMVRGTKLSGSKVLVESARSSTARNG